MSDLHQIAAADARLLHSVASASTEILRRSGGWIACRPGCTQCCLGPFAITPLDALRLQAGLRSLAASDPARAGALRARVAAYLRTIAPLYSGDTSTGALHDEAALPDSLDDLPCPALDPATGRCDLYTSRPITCRTFGPVARAGDDFLGPCELCYTSATDHQILACAVDIDPEQIEAALLEQLVALGHASPTIVAYALAGPSGISES
jgi:Fe-S-cluster containining protein